jgi:hypothetical protein
MSAPSQGTLINGQQLMGIIYQEESISLQEDKTVSFTAVMFSHILYFSVEQGSL